MKTFMYARLHWVCTNPGHQPDEGGYYRSTEGRFSIAPKFRHTVYPDSYSLSDSKTGKEYNYDNMRLCKDRAVYICSEEIREELAR